MGDCFGGSIAALIALPYGLAMASLMGLPPVLGIFTSILTAPATAILGRNPLLIGGTGSATVPFIQLAVRQQGIGGAAKVCLAAAVFMMIFCVLRLGRLITHVPQAVVTGFSCGVGGLMLFSQLNTILGVRSTGAESAVGQLIGALAQMPQAHPMPLAIGISVIAGSFLSMRWFPRGPAPLIGCVIGVALASLIGFHGSRIGMLESSLPPLAGFSWSAQDVFTVLPSAFGLAFVTAINVWITSRVVEHFRGRHRRMKMSDADAELGAYGIANICAGVFGAPSSVGIPARSVAAVRCGATTRMANLLHAVFLIAMLRYGMNVIAHVPDVALAGVTAWMGISLLNWSAWRRIPKMSRTDAAAFLATAAAVLTVNAAIAVAAGCAIYAMRAVHKRAFGEASRVPDLQVP
jgi:SulP family sulfate permease